MMRLISDMLIGGGLGGYLGRKKLSDLLCRSKRALMRYLAYIARLLIIASFASLPVMAGLPRANDPAWKLVKKITDIFEGGANTDGNRRSELEKQAHKSAFIHLPTSVFLRIEYSVDETYRPVGWPDDISLGNVGIDVNLDISGPKDISGIIVPGSKIIRVDGDSKLRIRIDQETATPGYKTFYPAKWTLKVFFMYAVPDSSQIIFGREYKVYRGKILNRNFQKGEGTKCKALYTRGDVRVVFLQDGSSRIKTYGDGRVIISCSDKYGYWNGPTEIGSLRVRLGNGTELVLPNWNKPSNINTFKQMSGDSFWEVLKGYGLQVDTATQIAGVRGTKFSVEISREGQKVRSVISVFEGHVMAIPKSTGYGKPSKSRLLGPGESASSTFLPVADTAGNNLQLASSTFNITTHHSRKERWNWTEKGDEPPVQHLSPRKPPHFVSYSGKPSPTDIQGMSGTLDTTVNPSITDAAIHEPAREDCAANAECKPPPKPVRVDQQPVGNSVSDTKPKLSENANSALDLAFWNAIKDSDNPLLFKEYLKKFPHGVFVLIASERLKQIKGASPNIQVTETVARPIPPTKKGPVFTIHGFGRLNGQTPFTLSSLREALPGYQIKKTVSHPEGITEISYTVQSRGKQILQLNGDAGKLHTVIIQDSTIAGPQGIRVGDTLSEVMKKVPLTDCIGGYDDMTDRVECSPLKDDDVFSFGFAIERPLPPLPDGQALRAHMLPSDIRLSDIIWRAREDTIQTKVSEASTLQTSAVQTAQQLLQQGNAIMDRAYRMDVSQWAREARRAVRIYREAAQKGSAEAWYRIGQLYESGTVGTMGKLKDNNTAIHYYEKAVAGGYLPAYAQIILVQDQFRNFRGAAESFFRFYRADPAGALRSYDDNGYSLGVGRAIQGLLKNAGYYNGPLDGRIGSATRQAIAAYTEGRSLPIEALPIPYNGGDLRGLAIKLQQQLRRVGCYHGAIDGKWGRGSARALRNFRHWSGRKVPLGEPTLKALRMIRREKGPVCGVD